MKIINRLVLFIGLSSFISNASAINPLWINLFNTHIPPRVSYKSSSISCQSLFSRNFTPRSYSTLWQSSLYGSRAKHYQSRIINPYTIGSTVVCNYGGLFGKYRYRRYKRHMTQTPIENTIAAPSRKTDYASMTPHQAFETAQQLMETCMLSINEKKPFDYYINEVVSIAHLYPEELCTQLEIDNIDDLVTRLEEIKDTNSCRAVISTLRPYWNLLPQTVKTTPKKTLLYNLWWRLSY